MALSQKNSNIGTYIAQYSSMCPLLVTGLGGLYSRLPNSIEINSIDWHRITPDDVTEIPELTLFMNALEFCNAVVQVAHEMIKTQLLDFMYQGFIVPVLGPALLQVCFTQLTKEAIILQPPAYIISCANFVCICMCGFVLLVVVWNTPSFLYVYDNKNCLRFFTWCWFYRYTFIHTKTTFTLVNKTRCLAL